MGNRRHGAPAWSLAMLPMGNRFIKRQIIARANAYVIQPRRCRGNGGIFVALTPVDRRRATMRHKAYLAALIAMSLVRASAPAPAPQGAGPAGRGGGTAPRTP